MSYFLQVTSFDPLVVNSNIPGPEGPEGGTGPQGAQGPPGPSGAVTSVDGNVGAVSLAGKYVGTGTLTVNVKDYGAKGDNSTDDTAAIQAAINAVSANGGEVFFPVGTYVIKSTLSVPVGVKLRGVTVQSAGGKLPSEIIVSIVGGGAALSMAGTTALEGLGIIAFASSFTGVLVDYTGSSLGEITRCYLQATSSADLLHLDQATHIRCSKVNFSQGNVQVLGKALQSSFSNTHIFDACRWGGAATAAIKNAGQAWQVIGGACEPGAGGIANFYRHDAGVKGENFSVRGTWFGDITATGPNQTFIWSGNNLSIRDCFCGWNDGTFLTIDENNCNGIVLDNNQYNATNAHNPTYAVDFGSTTGHTGFQFTNPDYAQALSSTTHGTTPTDSCFSLKPSPLDFGFTADPRTATFSNGALATNRTVYLRYRGGNGPINKIGIRVGTQSGNIAVAVYRNTGTGRNARPGVQLATSGSVACPVAGDADISLSSTADIRDGDWLALGSDNATVTFGMAGANGFSSGLAQGLSHFEATYPPPATASPSGTNAVYSFILVAEP